MKLSDGDHFELKHLKELIESQIAQHGRVSSRVYLDEWRIGVGDIEEGLILLGYSMMKNSDGDFVSIEHVKKQVTERIAQSGGINTQEIAGLWGISNQEVTDISFDLNLDLLRFESGRILSRTYARNQIMNLLEEDGVVHTTKVCRALGLRKEEVESLTSVTGNQVLLTESGMFILLPKINQDISSRLSTSGVLAEEMNETWGLSASETEKIVSSLGTEVLRMKTGGFMSLEHVEKEVLLEIKTKGELNPGGLAARLDIDDSDIRAVISGMSLDVIEAENGNLLTMEHVTSAIENRISSHGAADFRQVEKDLGVTIARLLAIAKKTLVSRYKILEDALIITNQKWLDRVRSEAIQLQKIHVSSFAGDHGVTDDGILIVLQKLVGGSQDRDYGLFVIEKERETAPPRVTRAEVLNVEILRGGEFVGNRFRFKVKIVNKSDTIITDVSAVLTGYPRESLNLDDERPRFVSKIEPGGFRSLPFEFTPTQDCVKGQLVATVSYMDSKGKAYSGTTDPFEIRAVCDLLVPETITDEQFQTKQAKLESVDLSESVDGWLPSDMRGKVERTLRENNFFDVGEEGSKDRFKRTGWAKGKYTGMHVGAEVSVEPKPDMKGSIVHLRLSGEDAAMLMPAMDELKRKLNPWNCPICSSKLTAGEVQRIKEGEPTSCQYCGTTLTE